MKISGGHLVGYAVLVLLIVFVIFGIVAIFSPRRRGKILKITAWALGGLVGLYLVIRGIAEFFIVHYNDPASYRNAWGGPTLAGVFAVHAGPGLLVLIGAGIYLTRKMRSRRVPRHNSPADRTSLPRARKG
jgi:uncharacterized protein YybS (DUF2232 family)